MHLNRYTSRRKTHIRAFKSTSLEHNSFSRFNIFIYFIIMRLGARMLWVLDEKTTKAAKQVYGSKQTRKPDKRKSPPGRRLPRSIRAQSYQKVVVMSPLRASSLVSVCLHGLPARKKKNSYILFSLAAQSVCTQSARLLILRLSTGSALAWGCACFFFLFFLLSFLRLVQSSMCDH